MGGLACGWIGGLDCDKFGFGVVNCGSAGWELRVLLISDLGQAFGGGWME